MVSGGASYGTLGSDGTLKRKKKPKPDNHWINNPNNHHNMGWDAPQTNIDNNDEIDDEPPKDEYKDIGYAGHIYGDSRISKLYLGSGGGSSFWCGGGRGGGALLLITNKLINKGKILSNGSDATETGSGGGSGGSILIDVLDAEASNLGQINAKGGLGRNLKGSFESRGGDGGNGRICINNKMLMISPEDENAPSIDKIAPKPFVTWSQRIDGNQYRI